MDGWLKQGEGKFTKDEKPKEIRRVMDGLPGQVITESDSGSWKERKSEAGTQ